MKKVIIASILGGVAVLGGLAAVQVSAQQSAFTNTDIVGKWESKGCETFVAGAETAFIKRNFVFSANTWQLSYTVFADPSCNVQLFTNKIIGPYKFGEAINANTVKVTWGQTSKFITAHVPDIQAVLNQTGCGNTTLPINTQRNVSVTGCMAFGIANVKDYPREYDILKLENNQLFTGLRTENMNLEQNRPTQIFEFPLVKR
jgi:hypothetical protein